MPTTEANTELEKELQMEQEMRLRGKEALHDAADAQDAEIRLKHLAQEIFDHDGGTLVGVNWNEEPTMRSALVFPTGYSNISITA